MKTITKQKIFFVYPPNNYNGLQENVFDFSLTTPYDMMMLSTIAKKRGYETKFCDYSLKNKTAHDFLRDLELYKPDYLVFKISTQNLTEDLSLLNKAKDLLFDTIVIATGEIFNSNPFSILQKCPQIDIALRQEYEKAFDEIIQHCSINEIDGVIYHAKNKITLTKDRFLEADLSYLPFLDIDLIDKYNYLNTDKKPQIAIEVARKHPNSKVYRYKKTEHVFEEIRRCVLKYDIKDFKLICNYFNYDKYWVQELAKEIIESELKISFEADINIDDIDFETISLLKKAGCKILYFKIESKKEELTKNEKANELNKLKRQVKLIKHAKIKTFARYITGFPFETKDTIKELYKTAKKLNTRYAFFETIKSTQGSKYFNLIKRHRLLNPNQSNPYFLKNTYSHELSSQEIEKLNKKMNKKYYFRMKQFIKMISEINSSEKMKLFYNAYSDMLKT